MIDQDPLGGRVGLEVDDAGAFDRAQVRGSLINAAR